MDWAGPEFVLAIIAFSTLGWLGNNLIRARLGDPLQNDWGVNEKPQDTCETGRLRADRSEVQ